MAEVAIPLALGIMYIISNKKIKKKLYKIKDS